MTILDDARREIAEKSRAEIEEETAWKWAARAVATYQGFGGSLFDAAHYYEEAIEHAALADHSGELLRGVREWVHQYVPRGAI